MAPNIFAEDDSSQINVFYAPPLRRRRCGSFLRGLVPCVAVEPPRVVKLGWTAPSTMEVDLVNLNRVYISPRDSKQNVTNTDTCILGAKLDPFLFDINCALSTTL